MKVLVTLLLLGVALCYVQGAKRCYHCDKTLCSDPKDKETCPKDEFCVTSTVNNVIIYRGCKSLDHHKDPPGVIGQFSYDECDGNLCNNYLVDYDPDYDGGTGAIPSISLLLLLLAFASFVVLS